MEQLDLKPLTKEIIEELRFSTHDLWVVKINDEVFGPFESQALKHYSQENEKLFNEALAHRLDLNDWQPFYSHAFFQRRAPQEVIEESHEEGPFWILINGQKSHLLTKLDLEKKIELGICDLTDLVSLDNGETWTKIFHLTAFNRRNLSSNDLPLAPVESSFQKAKLEVVAKVEAKEEMPEDMESGLASLAYLGQHKTEQVSLKIEEITLEAVHETEVSRSLRWAIPSAASVVFALVLSGYYFLNPHTEEELADPLTVKTEKPMRAIQNKDTEKPRNTIARPRPREMPIRRPASIPPMPERRPEPIVHESEYPTHVEMHSSQDHYGRSEEPLNEPVSHELIDPPEREHSLVQNNHGNGDESLDQQMLLPYENPMPESPIIEEASDF